MLQDNIKQYLQKNLQPDSILIIYGPTASGKSKLAIEIAQAFNGEIISADSRMVYKGTYIGADIPSETEQQGIVHHLIDFVGPQKIYSVKDFQKDAWQCAKNIHKKKNSLSWLAAQISILMLLLMAIVWTNTSLQQRRKISFKT